MRKETWTTPKGTKLELMYVQGGALYMQVQQRLIWLREEHPDYSITTEFSTTDKTVIFKAIILDGDSRILATAHKTAPLGQKNKFEGAETGAIGRALALCGFGTQFASDDLYENSEELADAPVELATLSKEQQQSLIDMAKSYKWSGEQLIDMLKEKFGVDGWVNLLVKDYDQAIKFIKE